jgi:hypothetical protein
MRNDGKPLEKTIQLIEETFKDSEITQIFRNHKIKNAKGIKREIDVLIKTNVSCYDMCIAIECKDYKAKVSAEKIEAFNSKCAMIKEINKMIFVSTNGFQSGAITSAEYFGIELITAEEVSIEYLKNLIPSITQLDLHILPYFDKPLFTFNTDNVQLLKEIEPTFNGKLIDGTTSKLISIEEILSLLIPKNSNFIQNYAILKYSKTEKFSGEEVIIPLNLEANFNQADFYIKDKDDNRIKLLKMSFEIEIKFKHKDIKASGRVLKYDDDSIKAHSINLKTDTNNEVEFIIKPNNDFEMFFTKDEKTIKLEKLLKFTPETNQFTKPD